MVTVEVPLSDEQLVSALRQLPRGRLAEVLKLVEGPRRQPKPIDHAALDAELAALPPVPPGAWEIAVEELERSRNDWGRDWDCS